MNFFNRELAHINVKVPNIEKAVKFYTEVLNFKIQEKYEGGGMKFVFITDGNVTYELLEDTKVTSSVFDHIAYDSDDLDADYEYFKNLDPSLLLTEIGTVDFLFENGVRYFFIKGSDNERIEFCQKK